MSHSLLSYERLFLRTNNYTKILKPLISSNQIKLEKGFQKKPIVAFTNSTVFILDFNI